MEYSPKILLTDPSGMQYVPLGKSIWKKFLSYIKSQDLDYGHKTYADNKAIIVCKILRQGNDYYSKIIIISSSGESCLLLFIGSVPPQNLSEAMCYEMKAGVGINYDYRLQQWTFIKNGKFLDKPLIVTLPVYPLLKIRDNGQSLSCIQGGPGWLDANMPNPYTQNDYINRNYHDAPAGWDSIEIAFPDSMCPQSRQIGNSAVETTMPNGINPNINQGAGVTRKDFTLDADGNLLTCRYNIVSTDISSAPYLPLWYGFRYLIDEFGHFKSRYLVYYKSYDSTALVFRGSDLPTEYIIPGAGAGLVDGGEEFGHHMVWDNKVLNAGYGWQFVDPIVVLDEQAAMYVIRTCNIDHNEASETGPMTINYGVFVGRYETGPGLGPLPLTPAQTSGGAVYGPQGTLGARTALWVYTYPGFTDQGGHYNPPGTFNFYDIIQNYTASVPMPDTLRQATFTEKLVIGSDVLLDLTYVETYEFWGIVDNVSGDGSTLYLYEPLETFSTSYSGKIPLAWKLGDTTVAMDVGPPRISANGWIVIGGGHKSSRIGDNNIRSLGYDNLIPKNTNADQNYITIYCYDHIEVKWATHNTITLGSGWSTGTTVIDVIDENEPLTIATHYFLTFKVNGQITTIPLMIIPTYVSCRAYDKFMKYTYVVNKTVNNAVVFDYRITGIIQFADGLSKEYKTYDDDVFLINQVDYHNLPLTDPWKIDPTRNTHMAVTA